MGKAPVRKAPTRLSTDKVLNRPPPSLLPGSPDLLSEGLTIRPMQPRSARIGGKDLGLDDGEDDESHAGTLQSLGQESRPKLSRKSSPGQVPQKFKKMPSDLSVPLFEEGDLVYDTDHDRPANEPLMVIPEIDYSSRRTSSRRSITIDGKEFFVLQGKFEGDGFEELMVKVERGNLYIKTEADPNVLIPFDLQSDCKVYVHYDDDCMFSLNHAGTTVIFKVTHLPPPPPFPKLFLLSPVRPPTLRW
jgi:hypothetical protein